MKNLATKEIQKTSEKLTTWKDIWTKRLIMEIQDTVMITNNLG